MDWITSVISSGFLHTIWTLIWREGLGIGLIILCCVAAYFSPFDKKYFIIAACVIAGALYIYNRGIADDESLHKAKTTYHYLKSHTTAQDKLYLHPPAAVCGPFDWGCGQKPLFGG